jgi:hypothetical protein
MFKVKEKCIHDNKIGNPIEEGFKFLEKSQLFQTNTGLLYELIF